jgi:hypothetical protein
MDAANLDYRRLHAQERAERLAQSWQASKPPRARRRQRSLLNLLRPAEYRRARPQAGN